MPVAGPHSDSTTATVHRRLQSAQRGLSETIDANEAEPNRNAHSGRLEVAARPSLRLNVVLTLIGNTTLAAGQWGILVTLARLGTPAIVGQYALALAITTPIMVFANQQLRIVQATDASGRVDYRDYLGFRLITSLFGLFLIAGCAAAMGLEVGVAALICMVGVSKVIESFSDVQYGMLQQRERMDLLARSTALRGVLGCLAFGVTFYLTSNVLCSAASLCAAWCLVLAFHDLPTTGRVLSLHWRHMFSPRWNASVLASLGWLTLPAGFLAALASLEVNIPRYFLQFHSGAEALGLFVSICYLAYIGQRVMQAAAQSALPRLSRHLVRGELRTFRRLCAKLVLLGCLTGGVGITIAAVFGKWMIENIYRPEYGQDSGFLIWVMAAVAISLVSHPLIVAVYTLRRFWWLLILHVLHVLFMATACATLIPQFGTDGAAYAMVLTAIVAAVSYGLLVWQLVGRLQDGPHSRGFEIQLPRS